jgi:hypothetical protein
MAEEKKSISIVYERNKEAKTIPVNGAFGGPTPDKSGVVMHLFLEHGSLPVVTDLPIVDGIVKAGPGIEESVTRGNFTREVQATVFMSAESAIRIGKWLIEKGKLIQELRGLGGK